VLVCLSHLLDEFDCLTVLVALQVASAVDYHGEIFGHETFLDGVDDTFLQQKSKPPQELVIVDFGSVQEASSPGVDAGN
jgi:hypothetical protein